MGVHEVSQLSLRELSTLWTDYVRELAKHLLEVIINLLLILSDMRACPPGCCNPTAQWLHS